MTMRSVPLRRAPFSRPSAGRLIGRPGRVAHADEHIPDQRDRPRPGRPARSRPIALIRDMLIGVSDTPGSPDQAPSGRPTEGRAAEWYGPHRHLPESHWLRQPFPAETEIVLTGADLSIGD